MDALKEYIEKSRKSGFTDNQIRDALRKQGWQEDAIGKGFSGDNNHVDGSMNLLSIAAMILSIIMAPIGLILGIISLRQIKSSHQSGKGLAIAAVVVGSCITLLYLAYFFLIAGLAYFGVMDPGKMLPDRCTSPPMFPCIDHQITQDGMVLVLQNQNAEPITITDATAKGCGKPMISLVEGNAESTGPVLPQQRFMITFSGCDNGRAQTKVTSEINIHYTLEGQESNALVELRSKVSG